MFSLINCENATVIRRQASVHLLVFLAVITHILTVVACERPPGETFPLAQQIDAQVGSYAIQPLTQVIAIAQLFPVHASSQENLLRRVSSILLIAEQVVNIGKDWPP